jgi:hypothetical protein
MFLGPFHNIFELFFSNYRFLVFPTTVSTFLIHSLSNCRRYADCGLKICQTKFNLQQK